MSDTRTLLAELFRSTGAAHHRAFAATNGDDPEWPAWYAEYLASPMTELLGAEVKVAELAEQLRVLDARHRTEGSRLPWPEYYAEWFLDRPAGRARPLGQLSRD